MINVFPNPFEYTYTEGEFVFGKDVYFIVSEKFPNKDFLRICTELWNNFTAGKSSLHIVLSDTENRNAAIFAEEKAELCDNATDFEYELECKADGVHIAYSEECGLIHAFSTLLQLISAYRRKSDDFKIDCILIKDKPALKMRGIHFSLLRADDFVFLKKLVRLVGLLKYSHVIIEFFGLLKFDCFKYFSWENGYTKEQIAEIVSDGRALGVEFIPMFNHLGHASQSRFKTGKHVVLDQAPEYEEFYLPGGWTYDVSNTEVRKLFGKVEDELIELFGDGEYYHMGCDEAFHYDLRCDGYDKKENEAFVRFLNEMAEELSEKGRKAIMWGDMFVDFGKFKPPYFASSATHCFEFEKNMSSLGENIYIADWQYGIEEGEVETAKYFAEKRGAEKVILAAWDNYKNIKCLCDNAKEKHYCGVIETTWNTIYSEIKNVPYAACEMWSEDASYADEATWETLKVFAAQFVRKLLPCKGNYTDAGFAKNELP